MSIEHARRVDDFYTRAAERGPLDEYHTNRWMKFRSFLMENDSDYIWAE